VTLTATANLDSEFIRWSGDWTGTVSPATITMTQDMTVTATFDLRPVGVPTYTLTVVTSPTLSGKVMLDPPAGAMHFKCVAPSGECVAPGGECVAPGGGVYDENTVVQLTAVPTDGYGFARWSGDLTATASMATLTMTRDMSVTASFELVWFEVYLPLVLRN